MNVQSIWPDEEYAFYHDRPNQTFVMNARRIRCKSTEKKKSWHSQRASSYVIGEELDAETGEVISTQIEVRARDIIEFWEDYVNERKALYAEKLQAQEEAEARRRERQQEAIERARQESEAREARARSERERTDRLVAALIERTGIPAHIVNVQPTFLALDRSALEMWLTLEMANRGTD